MSGSPEARQLIEDVRSANVVQRVQRIWWPEAASLRASMYSSQTLPFSCGLVDAAAIALNEHAFHRAEVAFRGTHKAHTLIHANCGLHHIHCMQPKDCCPHAECMLFAFVHKRGSHTPSACRWYNS